MGLGGQSWASGLVSSRSLGVSVWIQEKCTGEKLKSPDSPQTRSPGTQLGGLEEAESCFLWRVLACLESDLRRRLTRRLDAEFGVLATFSHDRLRVGPRGHGRMLGFCLGQCLPGRTRNIRGDNVRPAGCQLGNERRVLAGAF